MISLTDYGPLGKQKTVCEIKGHKSPLCTIEIGVPQGYLLGLRLFGMYVNDLTGVSKIREITYIQIMQQDLLSARQLKELLSV